MSKRVPVNPGKKAPPSGHVYSEYDRAYQARPEQVEKRVQRNKDREQAKKQGRVKKGDGQDVHHVKGAAAGDGPTRIVPASKNRSHT